MIAFSTSNVLKDDHYCVDDCNDIDDYHNIDGSDFILSIKYGGGYCVSKVLVTSFDVPRQLTVIMVLDSQADIVAVPELYSSAYVLWHSANARRVSEMARAFLHTGICEEFACRVAIAVDVIYDVIDRDFVDYSGAPRECIVTSSGMMELNDDCKERLFSTITFCPTLPVPKTGLILRL